MVKCPLPTVLPYFLKQNHQYGKCILQEFQYLCGQYLALIHFQDGESKVKAEMDLNTVVYLYSFPTTEQKKKETATQYRHT